MKEFLSSFSYSSSSLSASCVMSVSEYCLTTTSSSISVSFSAPTDMLRSSVTAMDELVLHWQVHYIVLYCTGIILLYSLEFSNQDSFIGNDNCLVQVYILLLSVQKMEHLGIVPCTSICFQFLQNCDVCIL